MSSVPYDSFPFDQATGAINLATDTIKVMLVTSAYTPNIKTHTRRSDITGEVSGAGYTAGGSILAGQTVIKDTVNDRTVFDGNDSVWPGSTITARAAVLYKSRGGSAAADELIAYADFGADVVSVSAPFSVFWSADGILYFGVA